MEEVDNARGEMKLVVWARGAYRYDEARLMISGTGSLSPGDRVWIGQVDDSRQEGGKRWEIERVSYRSKETAWRRA